MDRPIGMFDSGFGGLTVARAVLDQRDVHRELVATGDELARAIQRIDQEEPARARRRATRRDRLLGALDLSHRTVDEIMRHRREIEMIDADKSPDAILTQILASPYTRLPVFRESDENILGVIHAKAPAGFAGVAIGLDRVLMRKLGADPVNMPMGEVYSALAKGVIDGTIKNEVGQSFDVPGLGTVTIAENNSMIAQEELTTFDASNIDDFNF